MGQEGLCAAYPPEVGLLTLLLQLTEPATRPHAIAAAALGTGLGQLVGGLGATVVVERFGFHAALGATFVLRLLVLLGMMLWLWRTRLAEGDASSSGRRRWHLFAFRPHAGFAYRMNLRLRRRA